jgi:hypothetical protein
MCYLWLIMFKNEEGNSENITNNCIPYSLNILFKHDLLIILI